MQNIEDFKFLQISFGTVVYRIYRNKRPGRLIFRSNKKISKTHQSPSVLGTPPFEKSLFLVGVYFGKYGVFENRFSSTFFKFSLIDF